MDKVLIALGGYLIWVSITDTQAKAIETADKLIKTDGFLGMLLIFAILFSFTQYVKKYTWVASSLSAIIALGFWANKDSIK